MVKHPVHLCLPEQSALAPERLKASMESMQVAYIEALLSASGVSDSELGKIIGSAREELERLEAAQEEQ